MAQVNFKPVLPGIAGPRHQAVRPGNLHIPFQVESGNLGKVGVGEFLKYRFGLGALQGQLGNLVRKVFNLHLIVSLMVQHPLIVFFHVCRVHNEEIMVCGILINQQVVYHSAILIAHEGVNNLIVIHCPNVVGEQILKVFCSVFSLHFDLSHVRDIE